MNAPLPRLLLITIAAAAAALAARAEPPLAQPPLPAIELKIRDKSVRAEVADEDAEREKGLMFRESLPGGTGMLFVMGADAPVAFWMRNTKLPLSIAYINAAGLVMEIHDMKPLDETPIRSTFERIRYALEVPQGWFAENGILPGDRVEGLPAPPPPRR